MRRFADRLLARAGVQLRRAGTPARTLDEGLANLAGLISPRSVIDIGVADGTPELYEAFPEQRYLLVETNPAHDEALQRLCGQLDAVVEQVFCGREAGTERLRIYEDASKASRFASNRDLKVLDEVEVPVHPLDELVKRNALAPPYLLKVDVEGAELDVIAGAGETLGQTEAVVAETSVARRFQGGTELADLIGAMKTHGFAVFDINNCFDYGPGRLYQADLIFVRADSPLREPQ